MVSISHLSLLSIIIGCVTSGSVGKCRTECIEKNVGKIVRVHLKDQLVMIGLCTNNTIGSANPSTVTPFVCHRNIGLWTPDELDEEGTVQFDVICPTPEIYPIELRMTCPKILENRDGSPLTLNNNDEYPNSGDSPLVF